MKSVNDIMHQVNDKWLQGKPWTKEMIEQVAKEYAMEVYNELFHNISTYISTWFLDMERKEWDRLENEIQNG